MEPPAAAAPPPSPATPAPAGPVPAPAAAAARAPAADAPAPAPAAPAPDKPAPAKRRPSPAPVGPIPATAAAAPAPAAPATVGAKRRRAGLPPPPSAPAPAAAPAPAIALASAPDDAPALKKRRAKAASRGPRGAASKAAGESSAVAKQRKKLATRKKPAATPAESPPVAHEVFEEMATPSSFMNLLQDAEVDLEAPPLEPFRVDDLEEDEEDEGDDEEQVAEIGEEAFTAASHPRTRSTNYTEAEDILLVRAWAAVGMDATTGTDQTGKLYWQRIEDNYCRIKPKNSGFISRTYRSLQGRWELMKPACARWSAAMDQVRDAPPSGTVESDYETIAGMRYKEMAASKGKPFPFKHAWAILQTFDKWKLRDQETAPKKSAMLRKDDSEDEEGERNLGRPEGTKKGKVRVKMEGEASSLREKMEQMMKAREELTTKTLETKLLITEKKKEVKLAQVEAKCEEAKRKADLEERMIKVKEAKVWKELMVEEKEHMMMSKKDMDQEQLQWWKDYKEDIAERKRIFRGASSTLRGDAPMSCGGDGGVEDSTTGDNGGA
ncbi:putative methionyl-tRNA synthetase [Hordeum vulgare]|nr:putative methionyl-tRNA synthetase [Hordeum vulgare]